MAPFNYKGKDKSGQRVEGSVEANDRLAALRQVEKMGVIPVSITAGKAAPAPKTKPPSAKNPSSKAPAAKLNFSFSRTPKMKTRDVLIFST